jgi:exosortase/archaeosortase family protein
VTNVAAQTLSQPNRRPLLRFVVLLAGLFLLFNIAFYGWIAESSFFAKYLALNARASAPIIRLFEPDAVAAGNMIRSARFQLEIKHGCDALQPTAFFVLAMLASPVPIPIRSRILWILMGSAVLLLLNIFRIVTLFFAGLKFSPVTFETFHEDIWQAVFIFLPLIFWISWAMRATRPPSESVHAAS